MTAPNAVPGSVLVVDDNPDNRLLVREYLAAFGFALAEASDLAEARRCLATQPPGLVLLDLNLPDGHGLDLLRQVRSDPRLHDLPVAVLSANAMQRDMDEARAAGCDAYLTKPVTLTALLTAVEALTAGRTARPA